VQNSILHVMIGQLGSSSKRTKCPLAASTRIIPLHGTDVPNKLNRRASSIHAIQLIFIDTNTFKFIHVS